MTYITNDMKIISAAFMKNWLIYYYHIHHQIQNRINKQVLKKVYMFRIEHKLYERIYTIFLR